MLITIQDILTFKTKALAFADQFEICCVLDSNHYQDPYSNFDLIIAIDYTHVLECTNQPDAFDQLISFRNENPKWIFGGLGYDLKNEIELLSSKNPDRLNFPDLFFFAPKHLLKLKGNKLEIISEDAKIIWEKINLIRVEDEAPHQYPPIKCRFSKKEYIETVDQIRKEISQGNIYESNFCIEYFSVDSVIKPALVYEKLNQLSPTPFSNYFKWKDNYILSATPERFLSKRGNKLISQPIKGTARRSLNSVEDELIKNDLQHHPKEQQENVMIVDLVRNDLTKSAKKGSVKVEELFGVYSFKQVHQMISTVVCELKDNIDNVEVLKNSFPMGSMTGAPKIKAMELMEHYEKSKRGMYSGAVGYFSPEDDFDFNVIIRTILYNSSNKYLSFQVGSAITFYADAEKEYEECLLKAKAIMEILG